MASVILRLELLDKSKTYSPRRLSKKSYKNLLSVTINRKSVDFISMVPRRVLSLA